MLLKFTPLLEREDLVPTVVFDAVRLWQGSHSPSDFWITEIDPEYAAGTELCAKYGIDPSHGANCLVVQGERAGFSTIVACLVPVGYKYDMSGVVRKKLNARKVSVAPLELVVSRTKMEYGSITPIGLPIDWQIFIDPRVLEPERIIIGGGLKRSKLSIPSKVLLDLPKAEVVEGLAKKGDQK